MKKRALIVDDAFFMRNYIRGVLEESEFEICGEAGSAPEAVQKYQELKPDLVTMDIVMPKVEELDGIGAIKQIINTDADAKIVVISAIGEDPLIKEALASGAKWFLVKPFKPEKLTELIARLF